MKSCLCIRHFNVLMSLVGDKKRAESVLKHNATEYTGADDMLFGSTYEELMAKSLSSKKQIKGTIWFNKESRIIQEGKYRAALSKRPPILKQRKRGRGISQLLIKTYNNNTLWEDKQGVRINLSITRSISSSDLSPSEFCKIHPLVVNLFPVKIR